MSRTHIHFATQVCTFVLQPPYLGLVKTAYPSPRNPYLSTSADFPSSFILSLPSHWYLPVFSLAMFEPMPGLLFP